MNIRNKTTFRINKEAPIVFKRIKFNSYLLFKCFTPT